MSHGHLARDGTTTDHRRIAGGVGAVVDAAARTAGEVVARGVPASRHADVRLAVHEILVNALHHGHLGDPTIGIDLHLDTEVAGDDDRLVTVTIVDRALRGPWELAARTPGEPTGERGRGLVVARAACDALTLRSRCGATTVSLAWGPSVPVPTDERASSGARPGPELDHSRPIPDPSR